MRRLLLFLCLLALFTTSFVHAASTPRVYLPLTMGAPLPANTLPVLAASYVGGVGADDLRAVDLAPDGHVVVGGAFPGYAPAGVKVITLEGGITGTVLRLGASGREVVSLTRIGTIVTDLEIAQDGAIVVCGDFGVAMLSADAAEALWAANPGEGRRCAVGSDGTVAMIANQNVYLYDAEGVALKTWSIGGSAQHDITVDGASKTVIAGGYTQKNVAGACDQLKSPFVKGWSYSGLERWKLYDWSAQQSAAAGQCADSEVLRVALGRDGKLYLAGATDGGNTVFARDPENVTAGLGARQVKTDKYNDPYGIKGAKKIAWFGRFSPATGEIERGQFLLTRLANNDANSISPRAITAAEDGSVYLAGDAAFQLAERDAQRIGAVPVGPYEIGESFVAVLSPDLRTRRHWTTFAGPAPSKGGSSPAVGIAVRAGLAAVGMSFSPGTGGRGLVRVNPFQPNPGAAQDGYVATWQAR